MSFIAPRETLAFQLNARPATTHRDLSEIPAPQVAKVVRAYLKGKPGLVKPEVEAVTFYLLNHALSELRSQRGLDAPLGEHAWIPERYHTFMNDASVRMAHYILLICVRETRHLENYITMASTLHSQFGVEFATWMQKHASYESPNDALSHYYHYCPVMPYGKFVQALRFVFDNGNFCGGYGGPKWGRIAGCLHDLVTGLTTPELMMDTAWTLAHNGGPIFNKGMLYTGFGEVLLRILDLQRAGEIPASVLHDDSVKHFCTPEMLILSAKLKKELGGPFASPFVDWFAVETLGSVSKYPHEKQFQQKHHGESPLMKAKLAGIQEKIAKAYAKKQKSYFIVSPKVTAKKINRNG